MDEDTRERGSTNIEIGGDQSGQLVVGDHNVTSYAVSSGPVTEADLSELHRLFDELKAGVEAEAPEEVREAAVERVAELKEAVLAKEPEVSTMEYVKNWFKKNLPAIAGAVTSVVVNPIVGKIVAAAGDAAASRFKAMAAAEQAGE